jgi:hypothetical protein
MLMTPTTKGRLACRRDEREMLAAGYERVGEGGGALWELYRGPRMGHVITDVKIAKDGVSLWIKTEDRGSRIFGNP